MGQTPLRYLFVTADKFPPFRPDIEILFGKEMRRRGHRIDWVMQAADDRAAHGHSEWRGWNVSVASTNRGSGRFARVHKHLKSLWNEISSAGRLSPSRYDFVQVKDRFLSALVLLAAAKLRGVPFFYWLSFPYPEASLLEASSPGARYPLFYRIRGIVFAFLLYRVICRFADHVFVQSEHMKRAMTEQGVDPDRMTPVPMGVDAESIEERAADEGPSAAKPKVIYVGSLGRARKLEFLVDAFARTVAAVPGATLVLVGDGDEPEDRPYLERYVESAGLSDRVVFTGFLARDDAMAHVRAATVGASPIRPGPMYDVSSPTKILEYMMAGIPVVANDQPDQRAVLEASRAGISTPYEPDAFGDALVKILEDPAGGREMGHRGREYVLANRSYTIIADAVEARYRSLLGAGDESGKGAAA